MTRGYTARGGHFLFRNGLPAHRVVSVLPLDRTGKRIVPGAEVRAYDASGHLFAARMVSTGGGYGVQDALPVQFAVPVKGRVSIAVAFMSSAGRKVRWVRVENSADHDRTPIPVREPRH